MVDSREAEIERITQTVYEKYDKILVVVKADTVVHPKNRQTHVGIIIT